MNILLTCVGRRSYLAGYFKTALGGSGEVIGVNSIDKTPGLLACDKAYVAPPADHPDYVNSLLSICQKHQVGLLLSLFDIDLPYLAQSRDKFERIGACLAVSDPQVIEVSNDKWKTHRFLDELGARTPATFLKLSSFMQAFQQGLCSYPVVIKPRWGMGSIGIEIAYDLKELEFFVDYIERKIRKTNPTLIGRSDSPGVIIQELVSGTEFGVDVFNSLKGEHLVTVVKEKLAMRSGETDSARVVTSPSVEKEANVVGNALQHIGNMDMDIIQKSPGERPYILELNARFGGGYPFTHMAGCDLTGALVDMARGGEPDIGSLYATIGVEGYKDILPVKMK